jgi:hypothetical protein
MVLLLESAAQMAAVEPFAIPLYRLCGAADGILALAGKALDVGFVSASNSRFLLF